MERLKRLRSARDQQVRGNLKNAARQFAQLALELATTHPARARVLIGNAITLAPDSPKLYAISALVQSACGQVDSGIAVVDRFVEMIRGQSRRLAYETFFEKIIPAGSALRHRYEVLKRRQTAGAGAGEPLLDDMIRRLSEKLDIGSVERLDETTVAAFVGSVDDLSVYGDRMLLDLAVALMEMELFEHALLMAKRATDPRLATAKNGLLGEIFMRMGSWLELGEHARLWERLRPLGESLVECRYELLLSSVCLRDWDAAGPAAEWLNKNNRDYRGARELIEIVQSVCKE